MSNQLNQNEAQLLLQIKQGNEKAFEEIYNFYAEGLYVFLIGKVRIKEVAEEIIQDIFLTFWDNRFHNEIHTSLKSYLYSAAKYKALSYIRSEEVYKRYAIHFAFFLSENYYNVGEEILEFNDLKTEIESIISELPERCQTAFRLSRMEHLTLDEIAAKMEISKRTVENYITQALKHLRKSLIDYTPLIIFWYKFWKHM